MKSLFATSISTPSSSATSRLRPTIGSSSGFRNPPGTSIRPFLGSLPRIVTNARSPATIAAPAVGAAFRYQNRPQAGHRAAPSASGAPSSDAHDGQKRNGFTCDWFDPATTVPGALALPL